MLCRIICFKINDLLDFSRLVDNLLDLLTGGDHSKTKKNLDEKKKLKEEEETIRILLEDKEVEKKVDLDGLKSLSGM